MKKVLAWHFIPASGCLAYDEPLKSEAGYTYSIGKNEMPELCACGMHGSVKALDALKYAESPIISRVAIYGDVQTGDDKICGRHRDVLWVGDVSRVLHEFSVWSVRNTPIGNGRTVWDLLTDEHSRNAVVAKERWLRGEITDAQLAAARAAARDAAWSAPRAAVKKAAWTEAWTGT